MKGPNRKENQGNILDLEKEKLEELLNKEGEVLALYLYGSRSSGKERPESDTDIALLLEKSVGEDRYSDFRLEFLSKLDRLFPGDLDLVILNQVPTLLQFQVLKHGRLLYEADPDRRALMEVNMLNNYYLSKPFYEFHFENLRKNIKEHGLGHGQKRDRSSSEEARRISEKLTAVSGPQPE